MSAATILSEAYGEGACLYADVLGVTKDATPSQLRKAYYKKCLRYHPDKQTTNDEEELASAKKKFQAISLAYTILSNDEKRKEYDDSGDLYEEDDDIASSKSGVKQWTDYFDSIFPKVTTADIDAFEVKYKCSDEEQEDVLKYYSQFKGDLNKMLECVMLSSDVDKERWVKDYIGPAIERGDVDDFGAKIKKTLGSSQPKKRKTKGRGRKKKVEEVETRESSSESDTPMAEIVDEDMEEEEEVGAKENNSNKSKKKLASRKASARKSSSAKASKSSRKKESSSPDDDLIAAIRGKSLARREAGFDSLMAGLEDRYGGVGKKKKGKRKPDEGDIDDDEFATIQAKLMKNKRK